MGRSQWAGAVSVGCFCWQELARARVGGKVVNRIALAGVGRRRNGTVNLNSSWQSGIS